MLGQNGIEVVYIEGTIHWLGGKKHNYGHLTVAELPPDTHDIHSLLNNEGVLPKEKRNKAACLGVPSKCQTPSENCWPPWGQRVRYLPLPTLTWCYWHHIMASWLTLWGA